MKFTVNTSELSKKLSVLSRIVSSSNVMPILGTILCQVGEELTLTSSDSEMTIQTKVKLVESDGASFAFTAPVKILMDLLSCFALQTIAVELVRDSVVIDVPNGQYIFPSMDIKDFPSVPKLGIVSETVLSADVFKHGIERTIFSMADDQLRPSINGICIEIEDSISFASTDSYRISWVVGDIISGNADQRFIISSKTANLINSLSFKGMYDMSFEVNATDALFHVGEYDVYTRLVIGKFPPFKSVIPKGEMSVLTTNKSELLGVLKRVSVFSNKTTSIMRMSIGKDIVLSSEDTDMKHKATETVSCVYNGKPLDIGFKKDFISGVVSNIESEEVTMHFTTSRHPVVFDYEHVKLVLIPLKID